MQLVVQLARGRLLKGQPGPKLLHGALGRREVLHLPSQLEDPSSLHSLLLHGELKLALVEI